MAHAFEAAFGQGYQRVVILGTDLPSLPRERVRQALELLRERPLVLGPGEDGGYYVIGMRAPTPQLFEGIEWGSDAVLADTQRRAEALGIPVARLDPWPDVDTPQDLEALRAHLVARSRAGEPISCPRTWRYLCRQEMGGERMTTRPRIAVIIPALNEEQSIGRVIQAIPVELNCDIVVVDNGSSDGTARVAAEYGARVVQEPERGYGAACLAGLAALRDPEVVVFLDADFSDDPALLGALASPLLDGEADFAIGSRMLGKREPGAMPFHTVFGNWLAGRILTHLYHQPATDLGPFRAIRYSELLRLGMRDRGYGWTVEMQAKAARLQLRTIEIAVPYRKRVGRSKISGSLVPSVKAATVILSTAFRLLRWRG
jgi:CTP:molybdopterin cytidylyltransferase MocA